MMDRQPHHPGPQTERTFKLTDQELGVIVKALFELPYRVSAPIIESINRQLKPVGNGAEEPQKQQSEDGTRPAAE